MASVGAAVVPAEDLVQKMGSREEELRGGGGARGEGGEMGETEGDWEREGRRWRGKGDWERSGGREGRRKGRIEKTE